MTTVAVVRKNGVAAIAADTLTKWGPVKESATYVVNHEKILHVAEVPITFVDRVEGQSKMSPRIVIESMLLVTLFGLKDLLRGRR